MYSCFFDGMLADVDNLEARKEKWKAVLEKRNGCCRASVCSIASTLSGTILEKIEVRMVKVHHINNGT